jgi:hypothetical protein
MSRLSPLLFFVLALISAHVAFGAPSCRNSSQVDDCVSKCKHKFGLWPSSSTPSPTPAVDGNPYSVTTPTPSSSTYNPNASGNPPSNGGDDVVVQQPSTSSPTPTPTPTPTPSPTPSSGSGDVSADDIATWLSDHNSVRAQYGASDLTWSDDLSSKAQQWANGCVFKHSGGTLGAFGGKCLPSELISWSLTVTTQKILPLVLVIIPLLTPLMIGSRKLVSYGMTTAMQDN